MRRADQSFEIEIKAPTLGLVTRVPKHQPDKRAATKASNVRFERGVARNAPGYGRLTTTPELDSPVNLVFQAEITEPDSKNSFRPAVFGTAQKLWSVLRFPSDYSPEVCYRYDPLSDAPVYSTLSNEIIADSADVYGLLEIESIRQDVKPYVTQLRNWKICDNIDYCDGPDFEATTQTARYTQRWVVWPTEDELGFEYGKVGGVMNPVPADLFPAVDLTTIFTISICFDANARPVFAYQTAAGTITLTRYVAGTPTITTFSGDWPTLFFNAVVQRDEALTDVVIFYMVAQVVKDRFQRENFGVERTFFTVPDIIPVKLTKTDRNLQYQYLYFKDLGSQFWVARSKVYPPFPVEVTERAVVSFLPGGGAYTLIAVPYTASPDFATVGFLPDGGAYIPVTVPHTTPPDEATTTFSPGGGEYVLRTVDGGSYADAGTVAFEPSGGVYTLIAVLGGNYTDEATATFSPG